MSETVILNNRYALGDPQGTGGMAIVYRAYDRMLERTVAIKILRKDLSRDPEFRQRFHQEAKAAANLSHPNIVTIHDFGLDNDQLFIVMEYVPGLDLKSILQARHRLEVDEAVALIIQCCAGIGYAHRAGIVHCDVKPQNMLVTPDKRLKVVDFGIARALASINPSEHNEVVWGSPQYFSPEQACGLAPSPASDVYSLGVVMYELLTGQLPFTAKTAEELAHLHRDIPPIPPRQLNPAIPAPLEQIILKVLSKEPSARYRTADQMGRVLVTITQAPPPDTVIASYSESPASTGVTSSVVPPVPAPVPQPVDHPSRKTPQTAHPHDTKPTRTPALADGAVNIDWVTWLLALLTLITVGGLIPFWLWVYYVLKPPI